MDVTLIDDGFEVKPGYLKGSPEYFSSIVKLVEIN